MLKNIGPWASFYRAFYPTFFQQSPDESLKERASKRVSLVGPSVEAKEIVIVVFLDELFDQFNDRGLPLPHSPSIPMSLPPS